MNKGVSIVICCYNSADRLSETLKHISLQEVDEGIPWEVLVIDNASTDNTQKVANYEWKKNDCKVPFRTIEQPISGLIAARHKGIEHASYEYILFCDDDNWLCSSYVQNAYQIMTEHPRIGVLGGRSEAVCEIEPPDWFEENKGAFAVGEQSDISGDITNKEGQVFGAGMVVRASALSDLYRANFKSQLSGRKGAALSSAEDIELCYALRMAGYKIWYDERLFFQHYITANRLTWDYLVNLQEAFGRAKIITQIYSDVLRDAFEKENLSKYLWTKKVVQILKHLASISFRRTVIPFLNLNFSEEQKQELLLSSYYKGQLIEILEIRSDYSRLLKQISRLERELQNDRVYISSDNCKES